MIMHDSDHMNVLLKRIQSSEKAIPGTYVGPTFFTMFMHILDRLDALEAEVNDPEYDEEWEDCRPSTDNDDPEAGPII